MLCLLIILSCCVGAKRVLVRAFAGDEARPFGPVRLRYDVSSRICLAGLSVFCPFFSCIAWCVRWIRVGSSYLRYPE